MMMDFQAMIKKHGINITGVVHAGANDCQERFEYANLDVPVLWLEAIPSMVDKAIINLLDFPKQEVIEACLSDVDGEDVIFNVSNNGAQSSSYLDLKIHKTIHPEVFYTEQIPMKTIRFDTLVKKTGVNIANMNFLSADLQGAEYKFLVGMGDLLKQFDWLMLEVNKKEVYENCMLIDDLDYWLLQNGFERVETGQWVGDSWSDAIFRKI